MISIYMVSYHFNQKTELPESSKEKYQEAQTCTACHSKSNLKVPQEVIDKFREELL
ncbi:MAG: hypothetical protein GX149_00525 [Acholeplasmataceae bacterium]|nr:hypothetical protein [Acholeplasmataceae bacterium]